MSLATKMSMIGCIKKGKGWEFLILKFLTNAENSQCMFFCFFFFNTFTQVNRNLTFCTTSFSLSLQEEYMPFKINGRCWTIFSSVFIRSGYSSLAAWIRVATTQSVRSFIRHGRIFDTWRETNTRQPRFGLVAEKKEMFMEFTWKKAKDLKY